VQLEELSEIIQVGQFVVGHVQPGEVGAVLYAMQVSQPVVAQVEARQVYTHAQVVQGYPRAAQPAVALRWK